MSFWCNWRAVNKRTAELILIEQFKPGDWVLSAPECDPEAPPEPRQVAEVFVNLMPLLEVQVGGQTIRTTSEHPFFVRGKGWTAAKDLQTADLLRSHDGQWVAVESVAEGEGLAPVYNLRVAEHHTYFVGSRDWGFSVWAHNVCVTRWGRPGLQPGDWVMKGGKTWWNYIMSGKWQPGLTNIFAPFRSGQIFDVPASTLHFPPLINPLNWIKALIGQRIYMP
jgi:hypothetical protein